MSLTKEQKKNVLESLKEKLARQQSLVFVSVDGLKVKEIAIVRKALRQVDAKIEVVKKTLAKIALKEQGIEVDLRKMPGETALVFGFKDEVSAAKKVYEFSKTNQALKILGGFAENRLFDSEEMIMLAQIPTKEILLSQFTGLLASPIRNFESVLQGNMRNLLLILSAIKK
ncbi:MAG: 50S ribosomal protein L10 [bacterium]